MGIPLLRGQDLRASDGVIHWQRRKELRRTAILVRVSLLQSTPSKTAIHLKSLLNFVHPLKRFVYQSVKLIQTDKQACIEALIRPRSNSKPRCSSCSKPCPGYDSLEQRRFAFIPLWNIPVDFLYTCLLYTSPSPRDQRGSRMPSSA